MKKNVLVIMCDQLRKDFLGCYGNAYVNTPNIDSIAAEGLTFDQCFVNNPICMPNRMSMFTGMYPHNHGMWTNGLMPTQELPTIVPTPSSKRGMRHAVLGSFILNLPTVLSIVPREAGKTIGHGNGRGTMWIGQDPTGDLSMSNSR